jgi:hypothetical protein
VLVVAEHPYYSNVWIVCMYGAQCISGGDRKINERELVIYTALCHARSYTTAAAVVIA